MKTTETFLEINLIKSQIQKLLEDIEFSNEMLVYHTEKIKDLEGEVDDLEDELSELENQ